MKLVFEMILGEPYMWKTTEKHFKNVKDQLRGPRFTAEDLYRECCLKATAYPDNFYMVFNLKDKK
jgi:DNA-directed RNA polymerase specialized sigma24 family protein